MRDSAKDWVPPIIFHSRYAADFLRMWHAVSGMDFKYDPQLIKDSLAYDRKRVSEESDLALDLAHLYQYYLPYSLPLGFLEFQSTKKMAVSDFMPILAARVGGLARKTSRGSDSGSCRS